MSKYIAVKVEGIAHWFWFEAENVDEVPGDFEGRDGWGLGGAHTHLAVATRHIVGRIESSELQYSTGHK